MTPLRRILVPYDFSEPATNALKFAADLVPPEGRLRVLHVIVPLMPVTGMPPAGVSAYVTPPELVTGMQRQLERAVAKILPGHAGRVESKVVIGDPHQRILAAADDMDAIVMSTAGRTGLSHLLIGSVAEKVVRHSPIPVVTLRGATARGAAKRSPKTAR